MKMIHLKDIPHDGLPLFDRQMVFNSTGEFSKMSFSLITLLPGQRVPEEGYGFHTEDEYSIFIEGEVYTESGDFTGNIKSGEATLIPKGERHWCENKTNKPCILACVMIGD